MEIQWQGIDHVQVAAPRGSEELAKKFYVGVLGFEQIEKPETLRGRGGIWLMVGSQQLHIGVEDSFVPARKAHPAFAVRSLDDLMIRLTEHGFSFQEDHEIAGVRRVFIFDPFGNRIECVERS